MNLKQMLEQTVRRYGEKPAIISGEYRLSYTGLDEASNKVANVLREMGVTRGDRVAMPLPNSPEFVIIYFGIIKTGAAAVLLDTHHRLAELASFFNDAQPHVLVAEGAALKPLIPALPGFESIKQVIAVGAGGGGRFGTFREIMATGSARPVDITLEPEDTAYIAYSSGPSFRPRGIMLTHGCLAAEAVIAADSFQQTDKDILMLYALPLHHVFGLVGGLLASVSRGSTVVIVPGTGLSIGSFLASVEMTRGTLFLGVPYIFALAVDIAEKEGIKHDLSSIRLCASAGAPLPVDIILRFKKHYGFDLADCWGLTESSCHVTCSIINGQGKLGSVGKALPGWEMRVVADDGRDLPPNQPGEVIVRGPIMKGYYHNEQATAEAIKDGWLYSGDIGQIDEDGYLFLNGRKKQTIIVKGQNIYPVDIENVLLAHPKIAGATVKGIPDKLRGEIVRAEVALREGEVATEQELKQFCLERLASYKVPKQVIFTNSGPKTAAGQVD